MWQPVLDRLAAERDVIAVDAPGFGASPPLPGKPTIAAMADAVAELSQELGLERPHAAGNSMGGGIALELARTGRARSATGLSPIGFLSGRERAYLATVVKLSRAAAQALQASGAVELAVATAAGRTALLSHVFARPWRIGADEAAGATHNLARSPGVNDMVPVIASSTFADRDLGVPVTIAWGTRDCVLIPRQARRARRRMPSARHVWLQGCGHVPTWDDPDRVAAVLLEGSRG